MLGPGPSARSGSQQIDTQLPDPLETISSPKLSECSHNFIPANLPPDSYTAERLHHANPEHLYITSRRLFIGPIPRNWVNQNRKDWYKDRLNRNYSRKSPSFTAQDNVGPHRRVTGLRESSDARCSSSQHHGPSFPPPEDLGDMGQHTNGHLDDPGPSGQPRVGLV